MVLEIFLAELTIPSHFNKIITLTGSSSDCISYFLIWFEDTNYLRKKKRPSFPYSMQKAVC